MSKGLSTKKLLSWASLIEAMKRANEEEFGVRIKIFSPEARVKAAFYIIRKEFSPLFCNLSLLATSEKDELLIYHPHKEERTEDAERKD